MQAPITLREALAAAQHEVDKAVAFVRVTSDLAERVCGNPRSTAAERDDAVALYLSAEDARSTAVALVRSLEVIA
jgi:hypothetical protein